MITRFAPSPTGYLHQGHAYSALFAYELAQREGGKFLLRIEDIDPVRCKPEFTQAIFEDLHWLGLRWEEPVRQQSEHGNDYAAALEKLRGLGVLYPCFCTRGAIAAEAAAAGHAPHGMENIAHSLSSRVPLPLAGYCESSSEGNLRRWPSPSRDRGGQGVSFSSESLSFVTSPPSVQAGTTSLEGNLAHRIRGEPASGRDALYPGTCRNLSPQQRTEKLAAHKTANWRLDVTRALAITGPLSWHDRAKGTINAQPEKFGDVVLARKDVPTSYHLSVTVDDHLQGVTLVTRGEDLFHATDIHRLLQALLGYDTPDYHHHPLLCDETGRRYAKRDKAVTLRAMRAGGVTSQQLRDTLTTMKFSG